MTMKSLQKLRLILGMSFLFPPTVVMAANEYASRIECLNNIYRLYYHTSKIDQIFTDTYTILSGVQDNKPGVYAYLPDGTFFFPFSDSFNASFNQCRLHQKPTQDRVKEIEDTISKMNDDRARRVLEDERDSLTADLGKECRIAAQGINVAIVIDGKAIQTEFCDFHRYVLTCAPGPLSSLPIMTVSATSDQAELGGRADARHREEVLYWMRHVKNEIERPYKMNCGEDDLRNFKLMRESCKATGDSKIMEAIANLDSQFNCPDTPKGGAGKKKATVKKTTVY